VNTLVAVLAMWLQFFPFPGPGRAGVGGGGGGGISDDFNRADASTWGGNWTVMAGTPAISSNTAKGAVGTVAYWTANSFAARQFSQATIVTWNSNYSGPVVRASGTSYYSCIADTAMYAQKVSSGSSTIFLSAYLPASALGRVLRAGDVVRAEVINTAPPTLACYVNGIQLLSAEDWSAPAITSGSAGMQINHVSDAWDNWSGGDLP
jgi:hypothetical protein